MLRVGCYTSNKNRLKCNAIGLTPAKRSRGTVRWFNDDDWMAAKLVGLFGLIILALVVLYLLGMLS
jgi:hypothetical protein